MTPTRGTLPASMFNPTGPAPTAGQPAPGPVGATDWAAASGRLFPRHSLPSTPTGVAAVDDAIARWEQRSAEFQQAASELTALKSNGAIKRAEQRDAFATAEALEAGRPDPGPVHVDAHRLELTAATRRRDALNLVLQRADRHLRDTIEANRAELHAHAEREADKRRQAAEKALDALAPALDDLAEFIRLGAWAGRFPEFRGRVWNRPFTVPALGATAPDVIAGIRAAMAERPDPPGAESGRAAPVPEAA